MIALALWLLLVVQVLGYVGIVAGLVMLVYTLGGERK